MELATTPKPNKAISSKVDGNNKLKTPTPETELMRAIGLMKFYSKSVNKLHISTKAFYTLLHDNISFDWTPDLVELFDSMTLKFLSRKMQNLQILIPLTCTPHC